MSESKRTSQELQSLEDRYRRRASDDPRYSLLNPAALLATQERQRALRRLFVQLGMTTLSELDVTEVGCGDGSNLLELLQFGFSAERLTGIELLPVRHAAARNRLPAAVRVVLGNAAEARAVPESCDIVLASTVFSSLLDDDFQQHLAEVMWHWVKPGGGILWYDFTMNNPRNPDVRGVSQRRVRSLFPAGHARFQRITLAPPISRAVTRVHPSLYAPFNLFPPLRTHVLAWIAKR